MTNKELLDKIRDEILHLKMKELQRTNGINTGADVYLSSYAVLSILSNALTEESEDERIRKELVEKISNLACGCFISQEQKQRFIAYLEEQKDKDCLACDQHLKGYIAGRKVTEEEKQKENPKTADSIPEDCVSLAKCEDRDSKYGVFPEDVIVVARACEKLEAHGYPELAHALKNVNLYTKEQKPAEWSEEDADILNCCISSIEEAKENRYAYKETDGDTSYDREIAFLSSLRPSWKPSEEQMKALQHAIDACESEWDYQDDELRSLLNDIKKL